LLGPVAVVLTAGVLAGAFLFAKSSCVPERRAPPTAGDHLYTKVHGKWYDLAKFQHPGGPVALSLAEGRDSTALFYSHHLFVSFDKLRAILAKYEVDDATASQLKLLDASDDGAHFQWEGFETDSFTRDLRTLAQGFFAKEAVRRGVTVQEAAKASPRRWALVVLLMAAFFTSVPWFVHGHWWALLLTPQLAWVTLANYWHDALHFALSTNWRVNAYLPYLFPWLSSPFMWYHQHVLGHHCYTNIGHKDPDLAHAPQLLREHQSVRWRPTHATQARSIQRMFLVWSIAVGIGLQLLSDIRAQLKGMYNNVVPCQRVTPRRVFFHVLGRLVVYSLLFVWPFFCFPLWKAVVWAVVPIATFSWSFMLNSQINHLTEHTAHASDPNFYKHQVVTAQDFGKPLGWCTLYSGGLNTQIEHHLFPCVNHCHLPSLRPLVKDLCQKHGVPYREMAGYWDAIQTHLRHHKAMALPVPAGGGGEGAPKPM